MVWVPNYITLYINNELLKHAFPILSFCCPSSYSSSDGRGLKMGLRSQIYALASQANEMVSSGGFGPPK